MTNIRKGQLIILVGMLFLSEVSLCSWSWWENIVEAPLKSISQSVDSDTMKKLFPLVLLASVVGFYYWMSRKIGKDIPLKLKKKGANVQQAQASESITPEPEPVYQQASQALPKLQQYQVYSQTNNDGGGGASCGYHALLRSMQVVKSKALDEPEDSLQQELVDPLLVQLYFGTTPGQFGEWRNKIIIERKKKILKNELHEKFVTVLQKGKDPKSIELYKSSLGSLEQLIVDLVDDVVAGNQGYEFTDEAIKDYVRRGLKKLEDPQNIAKISELEQSAIMKQHLSISGIRKSAGAESSVLHVQSLVDEISTRANLQSELKGDWLDDGEIEFLWRYERDKKDSLVPHNVICDFKTVNDPDMIGQEFEDIKGIKSFDEVTTFVREKMTEWDRYKDQQKFFIFTVGNMKHIEDKSGTSGHWYGLVMHQKNNENQRNYYIMDSMNNNDRTKDANASKIMNVVETQIAQKQQQLTAQ